MAAITVDTQRLALPSCIESGLPVKAGEVIVAGGLVCVDTSGRALNGATTAGLKCAGTAREGFDNTAGADGVLTDFAEARVVRVTHHEARAYACNGSPVIGASVWLVDNNTVTTVAGNVYVGEIVQHDARGGLWYVYIEGVAGTRTSGAQLTENGGAIGGTSDGNLPDLTVTATSPGTGADATTPSGAQWTAAVNDITDLTAAVRELATKINAMLG